MANSTGIFHVENGQIIGPDGTPFIARGIGIIQGQEPSASTLLADFPGINFVRLAIYDYSSPAALSAYVDSLTSQGIVVEIEDHNNNSGNAGGSQGQIFTGQALTTELNWYSSIASAFKDNPYVWFGTNNEPSEIDSSGNTNPAALSTWQEQTVQAVRNAGDNNPVLVEMNSWGPGQTGVGYTASAYAGLQNIVWDVHYYGWLTGMSTDQATVSSTLATIISETQQLTSADGTVPVIIGEYGNSTTGQSIDPNGTQVVAAVLQSGYGSAAWAWGYNPNGDGLSDGGNGLSAYGQQVAAWIAAAPTQTPSPPPTPTPIPTATASPNNIVISGAVGTITDNSGNTWAITTGGTVAKNGSAAGYSANVVELAFVNGEIWQENASHLWWGWAGTGWTNGNGTATSPLPATPTPTPTPSPTGSIVLAGSAASILDASGNAWTLSSTNTVLENGHAAGFSANVTELADVNNVIWQENSSHLWWAWNGTNWGTGNGTSVSPLPTVPTPTPTPTPAPTPLTISVSSGADTQSVTGPNSIIDGDTFLLTGTDVHVALGATATFVFFTGGTSISLVGGTAGAIVSATAGQNTFDVGSGPMDITGGSGADSYDFHANSLFLAIEDFSAAKGDTLTIDASLLGAMQQRSDGQGGTLLTFGASGGAIDLKQVTTFPTILLS